LFNSQTEITFSWHPNQGCHENANQGTRPRGRPKKTWRQIVEKDCRARGLTREDAMDRAKWRKLIGMIDDYDESSG